MKEQRRQHLRLRKAEVLNPLFESLFPIDDHPQFLLFHRVSVAMEISALHGWIFPTILSP